MNGSSTSHLNNTDFNACYNLKKQGLLLNLFTPTENVGTVKDTKAKSSNYKIKFGHAVPNVTTPFSLGVKEFLQDSGIGLGM